MKSIRLFASLILIIFISFICYSQSFNIIPKPKDINFKKGNFVINKDTKILIDKKYFDNSENITDYLVQEIEGQTGLKLNTSKLDSKNLKNSIILTDFSSKLLQKNIFKNDLKVNQEGYIINSDEKMIILASNSKKGLFYSCVSLTQIISHKKNKNIVPSLLLQDWPSLKVRGISDDISRGQISTLDNFKKIIRFLAKYKMNTYMLYLEDMFKFKSYPSIGKNRCALAAEDIKLLQEYAKKYFVEIIPIFQTLGHYENILLKPEFIKLAEFPGAASLNTSDEKTYDFLKTILSEIAPTFESNYFHMGADESYDVGLGASKERVKKYGLDEVHLLHYKRVLEILTKLNKKVLMYGDILLENPQLIEKLPKEITVVDWHYNPAFKYSSIAKFKKSGLKFYVSPSVWNWRKAYPAANESSINICNLNKKGYLGGATGSINSCWGDDGSECFREFNWYGYAIGAASSWAPMNTDIDEFPEIFAENYFGISDDRLVEVLQIFADVANFSDYHDIWRHPFLPLRSTTEGSSEGVYTKRIFMLNNKMGTAIKLIPELEKKVKRNNDFFKYLHFCAKQLLWFADKLTYSQEIKEMLESEDISGIDRNKIIGYCENMISRIIEMKNEYSTLWLLTNQPNNLELIMKRYEQQISYWKEKEMEIKSNIFRTDYAIQSKWIYNDSSNPGVKDKPQVMKALFKKEFNLNLPVSNAFLQIIADDYAKIRLNGSKVGEVYARRTLSLGVEFERIKYWQVANFLKQGQNSLEIEVENFDVIGSAGINAYLEIVQNGISTKILSDSTWLCANNADIEKQSNQKEWRPAKVFPKYTITEPNFSVGRCSWIEK